MTHSESALLIVVGDCKGGCDDHSHVPVRISARTTVATFIRQLKASPCEYVREDLYGSHRIAVVAIVGRWMEPRFGKRGYA